MAPQRLKGHHAARKNASMVDNGELPGTSVTKPENAPHVLQNAIDTARRTSVLHEAQPTNPNQLKVMEEVAAILADEFRQESELPELDDALSATKGKDFQTSLLATENNVNEATQLTSGGEQQPTIIDSDDDTATQLVQVDSPPDSISVPSNLASYPEGEKQTKTVEHDNDEDTTAIQTQVSTQDTCTTKQLRDSEDISCQKPTPDSGSSTNAPFVDLTCDDKEVPDKVCSSMSEPFIRQHYPRILELIEILRSHIDTRSFAMGGSSFKTQPGKRSYQSPLWGLQGDPVGISKVSIKLAEDVLEEVKACHEKVVAAHSQYSKRQRL